MIATLFVGFLLSTNVFLSYPKLLNNIIQILFQVLLGDLNVYAPERTMRRRLFISLESRSTVYGQHDPDSDPDDRNIGCNFSGFIT